MLWLKSLDLTLFAHNYIQLQITIPDVEIYLFYVCVLNVFNVVLEG